METYEPLWKLIEVKIQNREIVCSEEVVREIKDHRHVEFQNWFKQNKSIMGIENTTEVVRFAAKILNEHQEVLFQRPRNGADAFVIALAKVHGLIVISEEVEITAEQLKSGKCPSIPNLCKEYNVECVNVFGFCRVEGYQLGPIPITASQESSES